MLCRSSLLISSWSPKGLKFWRKLKLCASLRLLEVWHCRSHPSQKQNLRKIKKKKVAVIKIENDETSSDAAPKTKSTTVEEIIKNDSLNLIKQAKIKKVEVAKKSTGGKKIKTG